MSKSSFYMKTIPEEFWKGDNHPVAFTVGALKQLIKDLPNELPVNTGMEEGVKLSVYNIDKPDVQLMIDENYE